MKPVDVSRAEKKNLPQREQAYRGLRQLLIVQRIPEGQRLREPEWAEKLGVNRMALREAFARLEAEGLIEKGPKTGYFVPVLSKKDIVDILDVRFVLECAAIEWICDQNPLPDLAPLREACEQLDQLIKNDYLFGVSEADRRFHEALIDLAANPRLSTIYQHAPLPMIHSVWSQTAQWAAESQRTLNDHWQILDRIEKQQAAEAQSILRNHLKGSYANLLRD